jgi:hypothetical protein
MNTDKPSKKDFKEQNLCESVFIGGLKWLSRTHGI